jgi:hypothetical protein
MSHEYGYVTALCALLQEAFRFSGGLIPVDRKTDEGKVIADEAADLCHRLDLLRALNLLINSFGDLLCVARLGHVGYENLHITPPSVNSVLYILLSHPLFPAEEAERQQCRYYVEGEVFNLDNSVHMC